jgi:ATP-binding cassette, subfamily B, multidrug efflux pump
MSRLWPYVRRHRGPYLIGLACAVLGLAHLGMPWVLKHAIDDLQRGITPAKLRFYALAIAAVAFVAAAGRFLMRRAVLGASRGIESDLRNDLFERLQRLPLTFFRDRRVGDLMSRATHDLNAVRLALGPGVISGLSLILTVGVATALMLAIDVRLMAVALAPLPLMTFCVRRFGAEIERRFARIQQQLGELTALTQESLVGIRAVRAFGRERLELERFRAASEEYLERNGALVAVQAAFVPSMSLLVGLAVLLVLSFGSAQVVRGRITIGELVAFHTYLVMFSSQMTALGSLTSMLRRGRASWRRMLEILDAPPAVTDDESTASTGGSRSIRGDIELRNVTFSLGGRVVLDDVSLTIPAQTTTAIVGPTGSGKSTLCSLLSRLHEPPPGTVFIDGEDVRRIPLPRLRRAMGVVQQETFLFGDSIAGNIAFGARGAQRSRERIEAASHAAGLDDDVATFPLGYDTAVGERGITLSGGQRQRTGLARALAVDPRILILDDALSAVDSETEARILRRLRAAMRGRTSVVVSHRMSAVRDADQIVVLDGGRIVERGRHDELVARDGLYAALCRRQSLEAELAVL